MTLDPAIKEQIEQWTQSNQVFLFMKGNPQFPQCGFSATVVDILDDYDLRFETCNVLENPSIREGIKVYSDWPTIPQLYVAGEFVGGCDIVKEMHQNGELADALGAKKREAVAPSIELSATAVAAFKEALESEEEYDHLRLQVDRQFRYALSFGPAMDGDFEVQSNGFSLRVDPASARLVNGMSIDFVEGPQGAGFKIDNPNEPPRVKEITASEADALLKDGAVQIFDVRTPEEIQTAHVEGAHPLDDNGVKRLSEMEKDAPIAFLCHHGRRSMQAAHAFLQKGHTNVSNIQGGIDAWAVEVDSTIPRY